MSQSPRETFAQSRHSRLKRHPERGSAAKEDVLQVLAQGMIAHIAWSEGGETFVIPMAYGLSGEDLVLHGSKGSRLLALLADGRRIAAAVTLLDGLVLARSGFYSSMNYRSVVLFGRCSRITDLEEKRRALDVFIDHLLPGRSRAARPTTEAEIEGTEVLTLRIEEATAKRRDGPPQEPEEDLGFPVWAGVIPFALTAGEPEDAPDLGAGLEPPTWTDDRRQPRPARAGDSGPKGLSDRLWP